MTDARIPITRLQAAWLADLWASGSETYAEAVAYGVRIDKSPSGAECLVVPEQAFDTLGTAVGIRADIASEGEYSIGERSSVLGLARKLAAAGITKAAPLEVT
jgi:hypothetical protein